MQVFLIADKQVYSRQKTGFKTVWSEDRRVS